MEFLDLPPLVSACGTVRLPGSKSISNRVLLLSALAEGETEVRDLLASDDTHVMLEALKQLGVGIRHEADGVVRVLGVGGTFPVKTGDIFLGNAGTAVRSLTAALALAGGHYKVSGVARMHERPIGDLVNGLREIGADVTYLGNAGFPAARNSTGQHSRWWCRPGSWGCLQPVSDGAVDGLADDRC
jgi:3-phosphoshikimate 1-carboxyvinyltransferase